MGNDRQTAVDGIEVEVTRSYQTLGLSHHVLLLRIRQTRDIVDILHQEVTTAHHLPHEVMGIGNQRMVGIGDIC